MPKSKNPSLNEILEKAEEVANESTVVAVEKNPIVAAVRAAELIEEWRKSGAGQLFSNPAELGKFYQAWIEHTLVQIVTATNLSFEHLLTALRSGANQEGKAFSIHDMLRVLESMSLQMKDLKQQAQAKTEKNTKSKAEESLEDVQRQIEFLEAELAKNPKDE